MDRREWAEEWERIRETPLPLEMRHYGIAKSELVGGLPYKTLGEIADIDHKDPEAGVKFMTDSYNQGLKAAQALMHCRQRVIFLPIAAEHALSRDWESFSTLVQSVYEIMPEAFEFFYDDMPTEYRRDFVIGCYMHNGDSLPEVRKAVKDLPSGEAYSLPDNLRDANYLTVYRAGEEEPGEAARRISWTLREEVARFFMYEYAGRHAQRLYAAKIRPADVIAYTDERKEAEILQYLGVYEIELLEEEGGERDDN